MIRELHQKGWTKIAIAQETGFDRKTVSKYINKDQVSQSPKCKGR
ncbi:transposase [Peribacillus loiseleuriae]|uniref:Transposase n=1 Tax=Peribacillus loiseleuriae TaxID=1679170 RepID=A0A0K9G8U2_9BACI|nr:transposase [Peribacillus loiseleuriae]